MTPTKSLEGLTDLRIVRFIAHSVDHQAQTPALSTLETPIGATSGFPHELFRQYILQALAPVNPQRRRAHFRPPGGVVCSAMQALAAGSQSFVDESRRIAGRLHDVMRDSRYKARIKAGDLMLALCQDVAQVGDDGPSFLAILKLDLSDVVIRKVNQVNGQRQVTFETRSGRVPEVEENKVQKIAVIGPGLAPSELPEVVLLDNNLAEVKIAHFFYDDFLECTLDRDPGETTQFLLREVKRFVSYPPPALAASITPEVKREIVARSAARLVVGTRVGLDDFAHEVSRVSNLPAPAMEAVQTALTEHLATHGRPEERISREVRVVIDPTEAAKRTRTVTWVLDGGIEIHGDAAEMDARVKVSPPNAAGKVTITITTQNLEIR